MLKEVWSLLLYVYGTFFDDCATPELLPAGGLSAQQYAGKWYFIAAVSHREADVQMFRAMDSTVFTLEETSLNNTLLLTGDIRIRDNCQKATWTYHIHPDRDDLELEGMPLRRSLVWSGTWLNCSQCIVFQEIEPPRNETESQDSLSRHMLYARQSDVDDEVVRAFRTKSACHGMEAFVRLPQAKEFCA